MFIDNGNVAPIQVIGQRSRSQGHEVTGIHIHYSLQAAAGTSDLVNTFSFISNHSFPRMFIDMSVEYLILDMYEICNRLKPML